MESSVDGEDEILKVSMGRRWSDAGRVIERCDPQLFAQMVAAIEATAVELSSVREKNIS